MKPKMIIKIAIDIGMTIALLLLMTYELIGQATHEWIGIGIVGLFVLHHILNYKWIQNIFKGKYTVLRIMQTALVILLLLSILGAMVSGVILSRHVLSFIPIEGGQSFARKIHMLSAYWGFVLMSLHLGFHWKMMMGIARKFTKKSSSTKAWALPVIAFLIAGYGIYAFITREIGSYMFLKNEFVFFDFDEPLVFFIIDYIAVMGLFVFVGHYLSTVLKKFNFFAKEKTRNEKKNA